MMAVRAKTLVLTRPMRADPTGTAPSQQDPVVRTASAIIGGPLGRHVPADGPSGTYWTAAAAAIVLGASMLALGVLQKGYCLANGWTDPDQFWRACYSDIPVVNVSSVLSKGTYPYSGEAAIDQPLLSGLAMWALAGLSPSSGQGIQAQQWVFGLWALLVLVLLALAVVALVGMRPDQPWQAIHYAASPVIVVLALISTDLLAITAVILALRAWHSRHPVWCGVLLGLAFLGRPYSLIFAFAILLLAWRAGQLRQAAPVLISGALTSATIFLAFWYVGGQGVLAGPRGWLSSSPGYGGSTLIPRLLGTPMLTSVATWIAISGWVLAFVVAVWLVHRFPVALDVRYVVALAAPMMLMVMLTAKSVSVQTGLWVLPFLALSNVPWRDHLIWAAAEVIHFEAVWLYIGFGSDAGHGLPPDAYSVTILARAIAWTWVLSRVWTSVGRDHDPVSQGRISSLPDVAPEARSSWARASSSSG